jgi:hypothetical protein
MTCTQQHTPCARSCCCTPSTPWLAPPHVQCTCRVTRLAMRYFLCTYTCGPCTAILPLQMNCILPKHKSNVVGCCLWRTNVACKPHVACKPPQTYCTISTIGSAIFCVTHKFKCDVVQNGQVEGIGMTGGLACSQSIGHMTNSARSSPGPHQVV